MLSETLATIAQVAMLVFVVTSMAAMGLSLTLDRVIQPLRDLRLVVLMVATVLYAPLVVPLVIEGATVQPWDIASSLVVLMLIPLGVGLLVRARYTELASGWAGPTGQAANVALLLGLGAALLVTWRDVLGAIGSWIFVGTAIVLIVLAGELGRRTAEPAAPA